VALQAGRRVCFIRISFLLSAFIPVYLRSSPSNKRRSNRGAGYLPAHPKKVSTGMKGINGDEKMDKSRNALTKQIWHG
jgi:hypothetical protein